MKPTFGWVHTQLDQIFLYRRIEGAAVAPRADHCHDPHHTRLAGDDIQNNFLALKYISIKSIKYIITNVYFL